MSDTNQVASQPDRKQDRQQDQQMQRAALPAVDVYEDESGITVLADMPGVPKEALEIKVEGDALSIEGPVQPSTPEGLEAVYAELRIGRFRRTFALSRELDTARIDAGLKDGVLTLRIPKMEHAQPRRIQVNAG